MRLVQSAMRGLRATVQGGHGGARGLWGRGMGGREGIDMRAEAGRKIDNAIVFSAISTTLLPLLEADLYVARMDGEGKAKRVENHPIEALLKQPVPWMSGQTVRSLWHLARCLSGNAYTLKHRSSSGKLVGLEYLTLDACFPYSNPGSGNFIDGYRLAIGNGQTRPIGADDVLHLRWHTPNPWAPAIGIGPLEACLPEIAADNRAARIEAAILRNAPNAHLLSPRGTDKQGNPVVFDKDQRTQLAEMMRDDAGGDNAGSVLAVGYPMDASQIGFAPKDIDLGFVHDLSEERVASCFGVTASWLNLGAGVRTDSNEATRRVVEEQALFRFVIPHYVALCQQLTEDLIPELGEEGEFVAFDRKQIGAYLRYMIQLAIAGTQATGGPTMTPNEWRTKIMDEDPIEGGDELRSAAQMPTAASRPSDTKRSE